MMRGFAAAALVASCFWPLGSGAADQEALRARQAALYEAMLAAPTDPEPMVGYARVSVELGDFDAAISTLERALIYEPNEPLTLLELGVAYFRIGSYGVAEYNIGRARDGGLPGDLDAQAALYLEEIAARTDVSRFAGEASFGLVASSNANNGPRSDIISFFGVPALIPGSATAQGDVGVRASFALRHRYDLGRATTDAFVTELGVYSLHHFNETDGDVDAVSLTAGPSLSLDDSAFGPKARPHLIFGHARVGNDDLYTDIGLGASVSAPVSDMLTSFGALSLVRREFHEGLSDFDSMIFEAELGATARVAPRMTLSAAIFGAAEFTDGGDFDNQEIGLRGALAYSYNPNLAMVDGLWTLSGAIGLTERFFDDPNPAVDPARARNEQEFRAGLSHLFRIEDGFGVRLDGNYFVRNSNIPNFDLSNLSAAISVVYEF